MLAVSVVDEPVVAVKLSRHEGLAAVNTEDALDLHADLPLILLAGLTIKLVPSKLPMAFVADGHRVTACLWPVAF